MTIDFLTSRLGRFSKPSLRQLVSYSEDTYAIAVRVRIMVLWTVRGIQAHNLPHDLDNALKSRRP